MGLGSEIRDPEKTFSGSRIQGQKGIEFRSRNTATHFLHKKGLMTLLGLHCTCILVFCVNLCPVFVIVDFLGLKLQFE
jgi:hypothetical protein